MYPNIYIFICIIIINIIAIIIIIISVTGLPRPTGRPTDRKPSKPADRQTGRTRKQYVSNHQARIGQHNDNKQYNNINHAYILLIIIMIINNTIILQYNNINHNKQYNNTNKML